MERLTLEDLARLVDEAPSKEEREALTANPELRRELEALRTQTEDLKNLPSVLPPRGQWSDLERELIREGLIEAPSVKIPLSWFRAAAGVALFLGGAWVGNAIPGGASATASPTLAPAGASYATAEEAAMGVQAAEARWQEAMIAYQQLTGRSTADPAARLAAIERLLAASQAAVREAPAEPFFNNVLVGALAEREQTLRQIRASGDNWY